MDLATELLMQRDDNTCHLCGESVDPDAPSKGPRSPSIDRIRTGAVCGDYTADNVRLAHLACNRRRQADPVWMWKGVMSVDSDKRQQMPLRLHPRDFEALKAVAAKTGRSMNSLAGQAVRSFLDSTGAYDLSVAENIMRSTKSPESFATYSSVASNVTSSVDSHVWTYEERDPYEEAVQRLAGNTEGGT